ncbi:MAG: hypothetical protein KDC92_11890 [Bacteroidetes bacterium]|nr:hypothetical protein [Bacteroidota bacterium]
MRLQDAMRITLICLLLLLSAASVQVSAQISPRPEPSIPSTPSGGSRVDLENFSATPMLERLVYGGNVQMLFGTTTYLELSPKVGYRVLPFVTVGPGFTYRYFRSNAALGGQGVSIYGLNFSSTAQFFRQLLAYAEYETLMWPGYNQITGQPMRVSLSNFWVGIGYRNWLSDRVCADFALVYNTFYNSANINQLREPFSYRIAFTFGW